MRIEVNGMFFDRSDNRCQCFVDGLNISGEYVNVAFLSVVDESTQMVKRYWGQFDQNIDESIPIEEIMRQGGKWPMAFRDVVVPDGADLYE